jgi:hypothetical protein
MTQRKASAESSPDYYDVEKNADLVLTLFNSYYRSHNHSGKLYDNVPDFFLFKPNVLIGQEVATRNSEKILLDDCIRRANERQGFIGVTKHFNAKLGYYWLELSAMPFMLGDVVTEENKGEFFYVIAQFIEFTKQNTKAYGDLTAEIDSDKDLALMLTEISKIADRLAETLKCYPEEMIVSFNQKWPVAELKKLLHTLKESDQDWCELFFEYLIYVMGKKTRG